VSAVPPRDERGSATTDDPAGGRPAGPGPAERLADQLSFLLEVDRLKGVERRGYLADGSRRENTAEHSWTLALMAMLLAEHAAEPVDVPTVVRMVVIHDIVEVDAGDTYVYDTAGRADKDAREQAAADRLYALLPPGQGADLRALWDEFEHGASAEARFARSVDRFAGFLLNHASRGLSWREHGITADRVRAVNRSIDAGAPALWDEVQRRLGDALGRGWIEPGPDTPAATGD
jgi:putative hydrolase of HD superfamily